eukprot:Nitzschia sp. Nitz4//scaffold29_size155292//69158//69739//NITZ4_002658-RA/size155292-exonerate_est2genome-gene-0.174-mRNA-1//1//CDS//3329546448//3983//frame0
MSIMARRWNIGGDLGIIPGLVLGGPGFPGGLFFWCEILVHVGCVLGQLTKCHARILPLELLSHGILVQQVGTHVSLGGICILLRLSFASSLGTDGGNDGISLGIVAWRRHVRCQLVKVTGLVSLGASHPSLLFRRRKLRVHGRRILGQLSKGHAWIQSLELISHGVLVEQISTHVALGCARISSGTFPHDLYY